MMLHAAKSAREDVGVLNRITFLCSPSSVCLVVLFFIIILFSFLFLSFLPFQDFFSGCTYV